jgi:2-polyprenyl-3-methyl-5-hydroxy-6-metoxy-1,4-benzoquinol methylase
MSVSLPTADRLEVRARQSLGSSSDAIYRLVVDTVRARGLGGGRLVDVGCGTGRLWHLLHQEFSSYCGLDVIHYADFPAHAEFRGADLDCRDWPIESDVADLVVAIETIEHVENPWAFVRHLVRIARPGGWILVTTPNQLSWLSLASLVTRQRFSAFSDANYPAHRTALLECDLRRMAADARLESVDVRYSGSGRVPTTPWHYPRGISHLWPRAFSDNVMLFGRKPRD